MGQQAAVCLKVPRHAGQSPAVAYCLEMSVVTGAARTRDVSICPT